MIKKIFSGVVVFTILFFLSCKNDVQNHAANETGFVKKFTALKASKTDSLVFGHTVRIKTGFLLPESPVIASKYSDAETGENNFFTLDSSYVFYPPDVLKITDKYILVLIKKGSEVRAATFKPGGEPIENIIISDAAGNNEWKVNRYFSPSEDFKYDPEKNEFVFTDIRIDTEWINFPTKGKDVVSYKKESRVGVKNNGRFFLISQKDLERGK